MELVDVDGVGIAWQALGPQDGQTLMLIHPLGSNAAMWAPQVEALAIDHRVVLFDLRGHGSSDAPPGPYALEQLALDVLAVADAAGVESVHLCGLSIGGMIALWLAVHRADRVRSVIASNTAARVASPEFWNTRIEAVRSGGMESIREAVVERWFAPGFAEEHPVWLAEANEFLLATSPDGYVGCCSALAAADLREVIASISVPTLVIGGGLDASTTPDEADFIHQRIHGSELVVLEGAAHLSNLGAADAFTGTVRDFLSRVA